MSGGGGCAVRSRGDSSVQMEKKAAISNHVPSAAQLATGQNTSVIRSLLTISPKSLRTNDAHPQAREQVKGGREGESVRVSRAQFSSPIKSVH